MAEQSPAPPAPETPVATEKVTKRVQVKMRKHLPFPYVPACAEGTACRSACDVTEYSQMWPFKLACQREPSFPLTYTIEQRRKGCTLFWDRYMDLWRADGHTTQEVISAWDTYDACMTAPYPPRP